MKGFTFVEFLIVLAIIGILVAIAVPQYQAHKNKSSGRLNSPVQETYKPDKPKIEYECIGGYKFVLGKDGTPIQIKGSNGNGVECFK